uniref:Golgi-associated, gamma adaptin ear containing, ARF binding protein 1 n=1 Tax=Electrophorus electricus TaxID=8005 RepID=A0AAY5E7C6_ELEEL
TCVCVCVLETCMKNCGKRFHNEVGKFRFLNELIKVVSPKYLGSRAPEPVKRKVLEMMYSWTVGLPEETKISDAYQMLKKQGIVKQDPALPDDTPLPPPPPRPKNAIFEDEEKSKMLSRLLNSTHPEDLRAANKLIKEMVQEDQKRMEKVSKRVNAIQEVKESVKLLTQLLGDYSKDNSSHGNEELIKDLYQRCERMRPTLFRLASDTEDNDEALAEILQANDSLTQVINLYRQLVKGEEVNGESTTTPGLKGNITTKPLTQASDKLQPQSKPTLRDLQTKSSTNPATSPSPVLAFPSESGSLLNSQPSHETPALGVAPSSTPQDEISLASVTVPLESIKPSEKLRFAVLCNSCYGLWVYLSHGHEFSNSLFSSLLLFHFGHLAGSMLPVSIFDKHSLRVLFHFARDCPSGRPDVLVVIISMLSSAPVPITNIRFQSAVPKTMRVKLQPPSGTELPAFNPILAPAAITQILLLANPHKEKVRLRYKLTFDLGEVSHDESGDVEQFPPPESWGNL